MTKKSKRISKKDAEKNQLKEIAKCKKSFSYFCRYLKIVTKDGKEVSLRLNPAQKKIIDAVGANPHVMILKARQLGSSTVIAAYFFWKALLTPNTRIAVVAHTGAAVKNIYRIYRTFYKSLPRWLQMPQDRANIHEMVFKHGSRIKIGSAKSESFRGSTYDCIHASEYAFWSDISTSIASLFQTAQGDSCIILESTPNGLNDAYRLWQDNLEFDKVFLSWLDDPEYIGDHLPQNLTPREREYIKFHALDKKRAAWAVNTLRVQCANNWNTFNQEYPVSVEVAFITSGQRVWADHVYPNAKLVVGGLELSAPQKFHAYVMGVDTASGSPGGDYSAFAILDVTNRKAPITVASFYDKLPPAEFAAVCLAAAKKWNAFVVVENNTYGLSILERLVEAEWPHLFRRVAYDRIENKWQEKLGFNTNNNTRPLMVARLEEYVNKGWLKPQCPRMQLEMNTFIYNNRGKPEHDVGQHDDMLFAHALALMGLDQVNDYLEEVKKKSKPKTIEEILDWERSTGKLFKKTSGFWDDKEENWEDDMSNFQNNLYD